MEAAEFWEALELLNATSAKGDAAPEAVALEEHIDRLEAALSGGGNGGAAAVLGLVAGLPAVAMAYNRMRLERILSKRVVRRGLSSGVLYVNVAVALFALRAVLPRLLLAGGGEGDMLEAARAAGIPDRATLASALDALGHYDGFAKVSLFALAFLVEKLFFVQEFFPLQVLLKALAPALFGGLLPGALMASACETVAAACAFGVGRAALAERLPGWRPLGGAPLDAQRWYQAVRRTAEDDGLRLTLLLRLAPVLPIPLDAYSYLLGSLPVGLPQFVVGHFIGCLKTAFLDASFGAVLLTAAAPGSELARVQTQSALMAEATGIIVAAAVVAFVATDLVSRLLGVDQEDLVEEAASSTAHRPG